MLLILAHLEYLFPILKFGSDGSKHASVEIFNSKHLNLYYEISL
jgi:hypothetical protein